jgi:xanthine/uracil/vitamin C permease (AzgA family)
MSQQDDVKSSDTPQSAASKLFDLRLLIGGLFTLYGVLLTIYGFFTSDAEIQKAAGINMNLWLGIGMLILGLLFLLWIRLAPLVPPEPNPTDRRQAPGGH